MGYLIPLVSVGAALVTIGAAIGISKIAAHALDAISRQPESANEIKGNMLVTAALIEGIALFALVICIILALK